MPGNYTYPGVYVQEIPSGVRTIVGVSTSDTAFVDFFAQGPIDKAVRITGFDDFRRQFGGLDARSEASYAIYQYFLNGGSVAWVVRVATYTAKPATRTLVSSKPGAAYGSGYISGQFANVFLVKAASPGEWGNHLQVAVDYNGTRRKAAPEPIPAAAPASALQIGAVRFSGRDQVVRITNAGENAQDMRGWKLRSQAAGKEYTFPPLVLEKGASVLVHSGPDALDRPPTDLEWGRDLVWSADADKAELRDPGGQAVYRYGYYPEEFNLAVREVKEENGRAQVQRSEAYRNLSIDKSSPRYAVELIRNESALIRLEDCNLAELPEKNGEDVIGNPADAQFLWLGQKGYWTKDKMVNPPKQEWKDMADGEPGVNGLEPNTQEWNGSAGAQALLGLAPAEKQPHNRGIHMLDAIAPDIFSLLCLPAAAHLSKSSRQQVLAAAAKLCEDQRAFLIVDIPGEGVKTPADMTAYMAGDELPGTNHAAVYYPRIRIADPLNDNRPKEVGPSGTIAGIYARTDAARGVWKAPAGTDAALLGVELCRCLTDLENGGLNPLGVNVLRNFPLFRNVVWGARTLQGSDQQASEWKYIPVRRTALYIEESLDRALKWVVFEPNDEPLWAQIRLNVGAFMHSLFRQGAFQGTTPRDAYFVKCDKQTTIQDDINKGIVNILVGFAPLKPAEFVVIKIQQMAGQIQT